MGGDVRGKAVKRALDQGVVSDSRRSCAKSREPCCALGIIAKQPVDIGADYAPVGRYSALGLIATEASERAGAIRAGGHAHIHFVACKRNAAGVALHRV